MAIRAALVGCGEMSRAWLEAARGIDGLEIVGLADIDPERALERAASVGLADVVIASDVETLLEQSRPDVLFDVAVPHARAGIVRAALQHGCHVLTEKPLAPTLEAAREIVSMARDVGRIHAVIQNRRYHPGIRRLRRFLVSGAIGDVAGLYCDFFKAPHFGGFREEMRHVLLLDMAIHTFDAARLLAGATPEAVYCREGNPAGSWYAHGASADAIFELPDGAAIVYRGSWCAEGLQTSWEAAWRIVGTRGTVTWDGEEGFRAERATAAPEPGRRVVLYRGDDRCGSARSGGCGRRTCGRDRGLRSCGPRGRRARNRRTREHQEPRDGAVGDRQCGTTRACFHRHRSGRMNDPALDIRIGTMVRANTPDPAGTVRHLVRHGFESIEPFFWQTLGGVDLTRLAGELRDAIGDADVVVGALGVFGNPLEEEELDRETLAGWEAAIDHAHLFGTDIVSGFTGRVRGRPLPESLPRFKQVFGELARRAADHGVRLAFENCPMEGNWQTGDWNIAHNPDAWRMMFDAVPDDNVGLEWEPCHQLYYLIDPIAAASGVDPEDLSRAWQGRVGALGRGAAAGRSRA